jgi:SAM-dependent methyltransferase
MTCLAQMCVDSKAPPGRRGCPGYDRLVPTAHYDGVAAWYDETFGPDPSPEVEDVVRRLVGPGPGACLDLGCGTGFHLPLLHELGWSLTGVDLSEDQLRFAHERAGEFADLIQSDAANLPFDDETFDLVFSAFTHTDIDDFASSVAEGRRVLRPGGRFVYIGVHPCFVGPHSRFARAEGVPALELGYGITGRYTNPPSFNPEGIRARVGAVHLMLGDLLRTFLDAGLRIDAFEEPITAGRIYPHWLALRAVP